MRKTKNGQDWAAVAASIELVATKLVADVDRVYESAGTLPQDELARLYQLSRAAKQLDEAIAAARRALVAALDRGVPVVPGDLIATVNVTQRANVSWKTEACQQAAALAQALGERFDEPRYVKAAQERAPKTTVRTLVILPREDAGAKD